MFLGLEKANAEALALKHQLESVTVLKVTAEDRASHLDAALKECMRQIRTVKEENDQKLKELILNKTEQWEKIKVGLEAQIADLSQRLLQSDAESAALSRSLQEQSSMLIEINEQKSQAEVDNELLKGNIQSYENEINSLKYELHVVTKEVEIRKEEKNMGRRSAEAANKQHLEDVKKMAKLEAECQRLRNLVRKKLPGPAALAQMKKEIGNMSHDSVEPQPRKPPLPGKNLLMEKEIKMLKEALVTKNSELQSSRDICAKMVGRFKNLEAQIGILNQKISSWRSSLEIPAEGCVIQNTSSSCNAASMSEDGSSANLQATVSFSDHTTHKSTSKWSKPVNANSLEIMDDFLEMERLACSANKGDKVFSTSRTETADGNATVETKKGKNLSQSKLQSNMNPPANKESSDVEKSAKGLDSDMVQQLLLNLLSKISVILESQTKDTDMRKVMDDTVHAMQEIGNSLPWHSLSFSAKESHPDEFSHNIEASSQNITKMTKRDFLSIKVNKPDTDAESITDQDLVAAVSRIHQFVLSVDRKVMQAHENGLDIEPKDLTASVDSFLPNKIILVDFFLDLSHVLVQASELKFREMIKFQLHEKEQLLVDLQSQLEASQKVSSLISLRSNIIAVS